MARGACLTFRVGLIAATALAAMAQSAFDTNFVELDTSKMMKTGENNYAICYHEFPSNWRSVSVNGDELTIATRDSQSIIKRFGDLTPEERKSLDSIRDKLNSVIQKGPFNVKSQNGLSKLTTFDRNGGSSSMGTGGSSSSSSSSSTSTSSGDGTSISKVGKDAYIICKKDFPFNWQRLFIIEDVVTAVYKDGRVIMLPQPTWKQEERNKIAEIRNEVEKNTRASEDFAKSFSTSHSSPMEFVNKAFGGMFGR